MESPRFLCPDCKASVPSFNDFSLSAILQHIVVYFTTPVGRFWRLPQTSAFAWPLGAFASPLTWANMAKEKAVARLFK